MMKWMSLIVVALFCIAGATALPANKYNLVIAPATLTENAVTLLWDKQFAKDSVYYEILLNGKEVKNKLMMFL